MQGIRQVAMVHAAVQPPVGIHGFPEVALRGCQCLLRSHVDVEPPEVGLSSRNIVVVRVLAVDSPKHRQRALVLGASLAVAARSMMHLGNAVQSMCDAVMGILRMGCLRHGKCFLTQRLSLIQAPHTQVYHGQPIHRAGGSFHFVGAAVGRHLSTADPQRLTMVLDGTACITDSSVAGRQGVGRLRHRRLGGARVGFSDAERD
mmetsp:Transcript_61847/g.125560  ORF Transcript_61847/g.125560 Transcript_61847/m.125560 type:complete len:203 (+) Transcript_61847:187-795(+)